MEAEEGEGRSFRVESPKREQAVLAGRWAVVGEKAQWKLVAGLVPQRVDMPRADMGPSKGEDCGNAPELSPGWLTFAMCGRHQEAVR